MTNEENHSVLFLVGFFVYITRIKILKNIVNNIIIPGRAFNELRIF